MPTALGILGNYLLDFANSSSTGKAKVPPRGYVAPRAMTQWITHDSTRVRSDPRFYCHVSIVYCLFSSLSRGAARMTHNSIHSAASPA